MSPIHTSIRAESETTPGSTGNRKLLYLFGIAGGLFACLLGALSVKFYVAFSSHEAVMTDDYYDVGRNFDEYRARMRNAPDRRLDSALLQRADGGLLPGKNRMVVGYRHSERGPIAGAVVTLRLNRRSTLKGTIEAECRTNKNGACLLEFGLPQGGYYEMRLTALEMRLTAPEMRLTAPEMRLTAPEMRLTAPEAQATARFAQERSLRVPERRFAGQASDSRREPGQQGSATL